MWPHRLFLIVDRRDWAASWRRALLTRRRLRQREFIRCCSVTRVPELCSGTSADQLLLRIDPAQVQTICTGGFGEVRLFGDLPYGGAAKGAWLERTCKVGSYKPNAFGLYDMHGNVWEWCSDPYEFEGDRGFRVRRGGSWGDDGEKCRSAIRLRRAPEDHRFNLGFRAVLVAREAEKEER